MADVPTFPEESEQRVLTASEMEQLSPNDRAKAVLKSRLDSLDELDSEFRSRAEATGRRLLREHGPLGGEPSHDK